MKLIIGLSTILVLFFGLVSFFIISIIYSAAIAAPMGILAGFLFGGFIAIYMVLKSHIAKKKYMKYCALNIKEPILFEDSFFRLNGNAKDAGHLYITSDLLIAVIITGKTILTETKIPLATIASIDKRHDYGHSANILITQSDGTETRFISDYERLCQHLVPIISQDVFNSTCAQKLVLLDKQHEYLQNYISKIEKPSTTFQDFLSDYFTGHPMIRGRGEEDRTVWIRLEGQELDIAIQMVLDHLGHDTAYIRAVGIFRDERAIPMLEKLVETLPRNFCYEKLLAARTLYDWTGFEKYPEVLADVLPDSGEYTKISLNEWLPGLEKETATNYIFMMLQDKSSFVRWYAYGSLINFFNLGEQRYEETKYYTDDIVYLDKTLFQKRLSSLKERIEAL